MYLSEGTKTPLYILIHFSLCIASMPLWQRVCYVFLFLDVVYITKQRQAFQRMTLFEIKLFAHFITKQIKTTAQVILHIHAFRLKDKKAFCRNIRMKKT